MSPEGRERRTKMGIYHFLSRVGIGAERMPRKSKNLKGGRTCSPRGAQATLAPKVTLNYMRILCDYKVSEVLVHEIFEKNGATLN